MSDFNTAKYLNKQMKSRGLQKLKYYCQVCRKQCRDDNGFRSHIKSPSHLKKINKVTQEDIDNFSRLFESSFLNLLKLSHGEKWIEANRFYNEFIQDKDHIHMNSTCFKSLNKFIKYLSRKGKIRVRLNEEENDIFKDNNSNNDIDMGQLQISYIDRSKENILRQKMINEIEKNTKDEQEIKNMLLKRQIEIVKRKEEEKQAKEDSQTIAVTHNNNNNNEVTLGDNIQMSLSIKPPNTKKVSKPKQRKQKSLRNVFD